MRHSHRSHRRFFLFLFLLLAFGSLPLLGLDPPRIQGTISFRMQEHYILISGSVGDLKDLTFAVDTGSTSTVLSRRVSRILDLKVEPIQVSVFGREVTVQRVIVEQLSLGEISFKQVETRVTDLPPVDGVRLDGLIGLNLLKRSTFTLNLPDRKLLFGQAHQWSHMSRFYARLPFVPIPLRIQDQILYLSLDTGTSGLKLYESAVEDRLTIEHTNRTSYRRHVGGHIQIEEVFLQEISLGTSHWEKIAAYLIRGQRSPNENIAGNLGLDSLGFKILQIDFEKGEVAWEL